MNLPNAITLSRMLLVPVFMLVYLRAPLGANIPATIIFVVAAVTDGLDGYLARSRNEITRFGQLIDPIADKLLVTGALLALIEVGKVSSWVALIILAREFSVSGLRMLAAAEGEVIPASQWGKFKTMTQIIAVLAFLLDFPWAPGLMLIATLTTIGSGVDYFLKAQDVLKGSLK